MEDETGLPMTLLTSSTRLVSVTFGIVNIAANNVTALVEALQFEAPTTAQLNLYEGEINAGAPLTQIAQEITQEPFTLNVVDAVIREYEVAFGRAPDQAGLAYWVGVAATTGLGGLCADFANSQEFFNLWGVNADHAGHDVAGRGALSKYPRPSRRRGGRRLLVVAEFGRRAIAAGISHNRRSSSRIRKGRSRRFSRPKPPTPFRPWLPSLQLAPLKRHERMAATHDDRHRGDLRGGSISSADGHADRS